jgi:WD40 repeat protein
MSRYGCHTGPRPALRFSSGVDSVFWNEQDRSVGTFGDGIFRAWNPSTGKEYAAARFQPKDGAEILLWPSTNPELYLFYANSNHTLRVKDITAGDFVVGHLDSPITSVAVSINLRFAIVGCEDGAAHVFNVDTKKEVLKFTHPGPVTAVLGFNRGDRRVKPTTAGDGLWRIWPGLPPTSA